MARPPVRTSSALVVAAIVLTGLTMRVAVTSVGAVLTDLQDALSASSFESGVITTLPVLCFAVIGVTGPRVAHRFGAHRVLIGALFLMAVGLVARALVSSVWLFCVFSVLALSGGAISNVLMPPLVKRHFPNRVGTMTAVYTTALAAGTTIAAAVTVPIANAAGSWRVGIGSWALLALVAMLPWLAMLRDDRALEPALKVQQTRIPIGRLVVSPTAWALMLFFALQSMQAYVQFGWFAKFLRDQGISATEAGLQVAFLTAMLIPVSMVIPSLAVRGQWPIIVVLATCSVLGYIGMLAAPVGGAWLWMLLVGIGSGTFPLALTMIGLRSHAATTTAALSGFVQSFGYLIAGTGPLLFGLLHGVTQGWAWPFALLFIAVFLDVVAGWFASRPRLVDSELQFVRAP